MINNGGMGPVPGAEAASKHSTEQEVEVISNAQLFEMLQNMEKKMSKLDDVAQLVASVNFADKEIKDLKAENASLKDEVSSLTNSVKELQRAVSLLQEGMTDLKCRSMRNNLIFSNIPEVRGEDTEKTIRNFMEESLKTDKKVVEKIDIARCHRYNQKNSKNGRPRPIVARFERFKAKELIKSFGKNLKDTNFGVNDQYPQEISERRWKLFPVLRKARNHNIKAVLKVDKLYIRGVLFHPETDDIDKICADAEATSSENVTVQ